MACSFGAWGRSMGHGVDVQHHPSTPLLPFLPSSATRHLSSWTTKEAVAELIRDALQGSNDSSGSLCRGLKSSKGPISGSSSIFLGVLSLSRKRTNQVQVAGGHAEVTKRERRKSSRRKGAERCTAACTPILPSQIPSWSVKRAHSAKRPGWLATD